MQYSIIKINENTGRGSPQHVMLERGEAQVGEMQGAAKSGYPKQTTPQRVGDAGRHSRSPASASSAQHYMLRTTQEGSIALLGYFLLNSGDIF